nr:hypothetical protein [Chitinophagaceae bacterium]
GETQSNLERIIRFGQQVSSASNTMMNSLFGDAGMPEVTQPKLLNCEEWTLTEKLEREKEMVGIYISAHPLDSFQYEMKHYGFMPLSEMESDSYKNRPLKIAGYISSAIHLVSKKGTKYGKFKIVDYDGEYEFSLFRDDYLKFKDMLLQDNKVYIQGRFQQKFYDETQFDFKIQSITLLENVMKTMTKKLNLELKLDQIDAKFVELMNKYAEKSGGCELGIKIVDELHGDTMKLRTSYKKIELNEHLIDDITKLYGMVYNVVAVS